MATCKRTFVRPLVVDVMLAGLLTGAVVTKAGGLSSPHDVVVAVCALAAGLLRRVQPMLALVAATAIAVVALVNDVHNPGVLAAVGIVTYWISERTDRRKGVLCAIAAASTFYLAGVLKTGADWWSFDALAIFAWIFLAAAAGEAVRTHKAYLKEVEQRAHSAEQTREEEAERRVLAERVRIARELHDVVAHHIAVISVQAGAAAHVLHRRPDQAVSVLEHIREASDNVLKEIQSVVGVLRNPGELDPTEPVPGLDRLPDLLDALGKSGFTVRHRCSGTPRELPAVVDLAAYRIAQEALTNAQRHGAGGARLHVGFEPGEVTVEVVNDIRPGEPAAGSGYGLLGMRERASAAGGEFTAAPTGDGRFLVRAVMPAPAAVVPA